MTELRFETPMPLMSVQMVRPDQVDQVVDANGPAEALLGAADPVVVDQAAAALRKAAAEVVREHREFLAQAEEQLLDLAIDIARKVLMQEVQAQRYEIQPIVAEALKRVPEELDVTVYLNPDDLAGLAEFDGEQGPSLPRAVTLEADPAIARGDCRVQTVQGSVESRMGDNLDQIDQTLRGKEQHGR